MTKHNMVIDSIVTFFTAFSLIVYEIFLTRFFAFIRKVLSTGPFIYFSGVAIGFMLIEITLIQRLILLLGHPTLSFVLVLSVLLVSAGLGSFFSKKWPLNRYQRFIHLLIVGVLTIGTNALIGWYYDQPFHLSELSRMIWAALMLFPLGFSWACRFLLV